MADDIFIKVGNEFKMFIQRTTKPDTNGIFKYTIPEDGFADLSVFLYSGTENKPEDFKVLDGKFVPLNRRYKKSETIDIKWTLNKNKIISIEIAELGKKLTIQKNQYYTPDEIGENFIQKLKIN